MNTVTITSCTECWEWYPANSYGTGCWCDLAQKSSSETDIPDWCPKLSINKDIENDK